MCDSKIVREQIELFRRSFAEHGDSAQATYAGARELQRLRFDRLIDPLLALKRPFSIHDVGAGLCDLRGYLVERGIEHDYSATEIVPEMLEFARNKYPGVRLFNRDILGEEPEDRHDFVVASGVFNMPRGVDVATWDRFVHDMIETMWKMAEVAIAFSFLTAHRTFTDPDLRYRDPGELLEFCVRKLSRFVTLDHGYPLFECTMFVLRPEFVRSRHEGAAFEKYYRHVRIDTEE